MMGRLLLVVTAALPVLAQQTKHEITRPASPVEDNRPNSASVPDVYAISGQFKRVVVLRFKFDTDLLAGLERMVAEQKVKNRRDPLSHRFGARLPGPRGEQSELSFEEPVRERSDRAGRHHQHEQLHSQRPRASAHHLSIGERALGGHLEPGTSVFTFALVTLGVFDDEPDFSRLDDQTYR